MILQLNPTIPVLCKDHGYGEAFLAIDYGHAVNTVFAVRFNGGHIRNFYSDDIRIVGNPMDGNGWDVDEDFSKKFEPDMPGKKRWGKGAKRNMDFLKS